VLFALDRWEARDRLIGWLNSGRVVIADRYVSANAGHQSIKIERPPDREAFLAWVERMEYDVFGLPRPDMVILLHMPWRHAQELVARKPDRAYLHGSRRDIHEADPEHLRRAEEAYLLMAQRHPEWRRIECVSGGVVLAPEEIGDLVWREVRPLVGDKTA
jgi:dTMP kinase